MTAEADGMSGVGEWSACLNAAGTNAPRTHPCHPRHPAELTHRHLEVVLVSVQRGTGEISTAPRVRNGCVVCPVPASRGSVCWWADTAFQTPTFGCSNPTEAACPVLLEA